MWQNPHSCSLHHNLSFSFCISQQDQVKTRICTSLEMSHLSLFWNLYLCTVTTIYFKHLGISWISTFASITIYTICIWDNLVIFPNLPLHSHNKSFQHFLPPYLPSLLNLFTTLYSETTFNNINLILLLVINDSAWLSRPQITWHQYELLQTCIVSLFLWSVAFKLYILVLRNCSFGFWPLHELL